MHGIIRCRSEVTGDLAFLIWSKLKSSSLPSLFFLKMLFSCLVLCSLVQSLSFRFLNINDSHLLSFCSQPDMKDLYDFIQQSQCPSKVGDVPSLQMRDPEINLETCIRSHCAHWSKHCEEAKSDLSYTKFISWPNFKKQKPNKPSTSALG